LDSLHERGLQVALGEGVDGLGDSLELHHVFLSIVNVKETELLLVGDYGEH